MDEEAAGWRIVLKVVGVEVIPKLDTVLVIMLVALRSDMAPVSGTSSLLLKR